jgi:Tol biopolymer transport system component
VKAGSEAMIGSRLGPYEIVAPLGAGGMGEVYRARDSKLGRSVAVKVLPEALAADPERITRFEREAKALAALNHPHIATLHGMEEAGGRHFLVMELVEGETLAERIQRGALPVEEALAIARQIAEGLEAAHEKGIVHRDLKPANVKITPDDRVKVLDFGLAKAMEAEPAPANLAHSPTLSLMATQAGVILGTASYMSPEQAKGLPADHRSDVFSFGVVLFEMLSGRQPFQGETAPDILASVLVREPDLGGLPPDLNPRLYDLIKRCLDKNPKRRWQAIGDLRAEIETLAANPRAAPVAASGVAAARRPLWRRALPVIAGAIAAGAIAGVTAWKLKPETRAAVTRFSIPLGEGQEFSGTNRRMVALSADGTSIVYVANRRFYSRSLAELEARPIPGTETMQSPQDPVISPDGRSIAFYVVSDSTIKRMARDGGAAVTVCPAATGTLGLAWHNDSILFAEPNQGILRVSANGGKPEVVVKIQTGERAYGPQMLPDGQTVLFTLATAPGPERWDNARIVAQSLKSGQRTTLVEGGSAGYYVPTGHLVYAHNGVLFAVPLDLSRMAPAGGPVPVIEGVRRAVGGSAAAQFAVSGSGTLIFIPGPVNPTSMQLQLAFFDRNGRGEALKIPPGPYDLPRVSPDGKQVACASDDGKETVLWVYDLSNAASVRRLTFGGRNRFPEWSADSQKVAFQSDREGDLGIFWQRADGTGTAERLTRPEQGTSHVPHSWAPDGERLLFDVEKDGRFSLWTFSLRDKKATRFDAVESTSPTGAVFSPDSRWVAYSTGEARNRSVVYVQPFPTSGAKYQVSKSSEDGHHPLWSPDGRELFYTPGGGHRLLVASIATKPTFTFGEPTPVARPFNNAAPVFARPYDIARDGKRILGLSESVQGETTSASAPRIHVILNWFEELKTRVPTR